MGMRMERKQRSFTPIRIMGASETVRKLIGTSSAVIHSYCVNIKISTVNSLLSFTVSNAFLSLKSSYFSSFPPHISYPTLTPSAFYIYSCLTWIFHISFVLYGEPLVPPDSRFSLVYSYTRIRHSFDDPKHTLRRFQFKPLI